MISETDISSRGRSLEQLENGPRDNLGPFLFAATFSAGAAIRKPQRGLASSCGESSCG
jgi:hypothetical protein